MGHRVEGGERVNAEVGMGNGEVGIIVQRVERTEGGSWKVR
jgi:hypothetical protein